MCKCVLRVFCCETVFCVGGRTHPRSLIYCDSKCVLLRFVHRCAMLGSVCFLDLFLVSLAIAIENVFLTAVLNVCRSCVFIKL